MVQFLRDSCCAPCLYWAVPTLMACAMGTNISKNQHLYPKDANGNAAASTQNGVTVSAGRHLEERDFTLWRDCTRNDFTNEKVCGFLEVNNLTATADCTKFKHTTRATRAFYIMALVLAVFTLLALIAASCGTIGWMIPAILMVLVAIFTLIAIILAAYLYDRSDKPNGAFCNYAGSWVNGSNPHRELESDADDRVKGDIGPSIPLMIAAWFLNAFAGCWNCALKDGKEAIQKVVPYGGESAEY